MTAAGGTAVAQRCLRDGDRFPDRRATSRRTTTSTPVFTATDIEPGDRHVVRAVCPEPARWRPAPRCVAFSKAVPAGSVVLQVVDAAATAVPGTKTYDDDDEDRDLQPGPGPRRQHDLHGHGQRSGTGGTRSSGPSPPPRPDGDAERLPVHALQRRPTTRRQARTRTPPGPAGHGLHRRRARPDRRGPVLQDPENVGTTPSRCGPAAPSWPRPPWSARPPRAGSRPLSRRPVESPAAPPTSPLTQRRTGGTPTRLKD